MSDFCVQFLSNEGLELKTRLAQVTAERNESKAAAERLIKGILAIFDEVYPIIIADPKEADDDTK